MLVSVPGQVLQTWEVIYSLARAVTSSRQKSATIRPQTGGAPPYRCPARIVVAPAPYRPTPIATTATADSRVVLDPSGGTEVSRMT
jgi:hypothetical protein